MNVPRRQQAILIPLLPEAVRAYLTQAASAATTSRNAMRGLSATARCAICVVGAMFQNNRPGQSIRRRKPHHVASLTASYAIEALERAHHRRTAPPTASAWPISSSIESKLRSAYELSPQIVPRAHAGNAAIGREW